MAKSKQKQLSLQDRVNIIDQSNKKSQRELASSFNVSLGTVNKVIKERNQIMERFLSGESKEQTRKQEPKFCRLEQRLLSWFHTARSRNIVVTGPLLQTKALEIAKNMDVDFKASNGWLYRFQKRHNIACKSLRGESADVSEDAVNSWKTDILPRLVEGYAKEDVFNADETALFYRQLPKKSLVAVGDDTSGVKVMKERLTILLACSQTGEKLKPLVIGKSNKPRCFKNIDVRKLPILWRSNSKAWMTSAIFTEWLKDINKEMARQKRKILLLIDNAPTHPQNLEFTNLEVRFLPAKTTSRLQPLDQGIIWSFKSHFKQRLLTHQIRWVDADESKSVTDLCKSVNVLDAINWISEAWKKVSTQTIMNCFRKAGLGESSETIEEEECDGLTETLQKAAAVQICEEGAFEASIEIEEGLSIHEGAGESWENDLTRPPTANQPEEEIEMDDQEEDQQPTTRKELNEAIETVKRFCAENAMLECLGKISSLQYEITRELLFKANPTRQSTLDSWCVMNRHQ